MVAGVRHYNVPPDRLAEIGEALRTAVRTERGGYDTRLLAAFLGVDRQSGRSVAVTVASEEAALERSPAEPRDAVPSDVVRYDVAEAYVADPDAFEACATPRLHLSTETPCRAPQDDPLVGAAFGLESGDPPATLLVAFAEWPQWMQRTGGTADVYDLEYFMVRHGAPVS